jgi:hypothetical protein
MFKYLCRYAHSLLSGYGPCNIVGKLKGVSGSGHWARLLFGSDEVGKRTGGGERAVFNPLTPYQRVWSRTCL